MTDNNFDIQNKDISKALKDAIEDLGMVVSLKEHVEKRIDTLKELIESKIYSIEKAANLASENVKTRLEILNEARGSLRDMASTFITREIFDSEIRQRDDNIKVLAEKHEKDLKPLNTFKDGMEGKASRTSVNVSLFFAILASIIAIATFVFGIIK